MKYDMAQMEVDADNSIDFIFNILNKDPDARIWLEEKVGMPLITDIVWGTADIVIYLPQLDELWVLDYKYGRVEVHAEYNEQGLLYLISVMQTLLPGRPLPRVMNIGIIQPRGRDILDIWKVEPGYIFDEFMPKFKEALIRINPSYFKRLQFERDHGKWGEKILPQYHISEDSCKWCPALALCPAAQAKAIEMCDFQDLREAPDLEKVLPLFPMLRNWMDAVEKEAIGILSTGGEVPGYHLAAGRTHRKWRDEQEVITFLCGKGLPLKAIAPPKILSPSQMEKVMQKGTKKIAKSELAPYTHQPEGKPKLQKTS